VRICELDDPLGARIDGPVHWVAEAGHPLAGRVYVARDLERLALKVRRE
jgi:hypothetical protein